ncbi:hypothetical protein [Paenibacillus ferrarius]|uniref:hypothetical protein n=1 Tax=Paenibacillus ferrarius TaxID=1469647 RepID=UPI003D27A938
MYNAKHTDSLNSVKHTIITKWRTDLVRLYPGFYNEEMLIKEASIYFDFLLEMDIPVEQHAISQRIPEMCEHFINKNIPLTHITLSNQLWIDSILHLVQEDDVGKSMPIATMRKLVWRVLEYERVFLEQYNRLCSATDTGARSSLE